MQFLLSIKGALSGWTLNRVWEGGVAESQTFLAEFSSLCWAWAWSLRDTGCEWVIWCEQTLKSLEWDSEKEWNSYSHLFPPTLVSVFVLPSPPALMHLFVSCNINHVFKAAWIESIPTFLFCLFIPFFTTGVISMTWVKRGPLAFMLSICSELVNSSMEAEELDRGIRKSPGYFCD